MSLIKRMRRQRATYWATTTKDRFGTYSFADPVEIRCRWEDEQVDFRDFNNQEATSKSVVYVDREMKPGDRLKFGPMETDAAAPVIDETLEVRSTTRLPNLRCKENLLTAYLC